jgi:hypothetical protein
LKKIYSIRELVTKNNYGMKYLLFLTLSLLTINANAQSEAKETVKTYIEIWSMHKSSTPTIDTGEGKGSEKYKAENGEVIEFHSSIGAVNWFVSNGWKLESEHMSTCNDRTIKMYVVSKDVPKEQVKSKENKYIKK